MFFSYFSLACPSEGAPPDLLLYMFVDGSFSAVIQPAVDDDAEVLAQCMLVCVTAVSLTPDPPPHTGTVYHRKWAQLWSPRLDGKHCHTMISNFV